MFCLLFLLLSYGRQPTENPFKKTWWIPKMNPQHKKSNTFPWIFSLKYLKNLSINSQIDKQLELGAQQNRGQNVALLETPNGITLLGASKLREVNGNGNGQQDRLSVERRHHDEDDSFEYGTDRESSVYNPTTRPLKSILMSQAAGRNSRSSASDKDEGNENADLLQKGNQLGIPESRFSRWLPKDQRELIEKQAMLLSGRGKSTAPATPPKPQRPPMGTTTTATTTTTPTTPKLPQETEIWACARVCVRAHGVHIYLFLFRYRKRPAGLRMEQSCDHRELFGGQP